MKTYYNRDGQIDEGGSDDPDELGFTIETDEKTGVMVASADQFYSKLGRCEMTVTPDVSESRLAFAFAAALKVFR